MADNPLKTMGIVAGGIAAVIGLAFLILPQLNPESTHAGEIVEVRDTEYLGDSVIYNVRAHLTGFNGKTCPLRFNIRNQTLGTLVVEGVDAGTYGPESQDETAALDVRVFTEPLPTGTYYVEFVLFDNDGFTELDRETSRPFNKTSG
jgi:hypothetical protein